MEIDRQNTSSGAARHLFHLAQSSRCCAPLVSPASSTLPIWGRVLEPSRGRLMMALLNNEQYSAITFKHR